MKQKVEYVNLKDIHLWSENPRDPIVSGNNDSIIRHALLNIGSVNWGLKKLEKEMSSGFDFSEIPTLVNESGKLVAYDGNRRLIILLLAQDKAKYQKAFGHEPSDELNSLNEIPCNVCTKETAISHVFRKHANTGSWSPINQEIFQHKHMGMPEGTLMLLNKITGAIDKDPKRFDKKQIKEELLTEKNVKDLKIDLDKPKKKDKDKLIDILDLVPKDKNDKENVVSSRENRKPDADKILSLIKARKHNNSEGLEEADGVSVSEEKSLREKRRTPRQKGEIGDMFGEKLYLKSGSTNSLYMDICSLYEYYLKNKDNLSNLFPGIIRMSLRLLVETALEKKYVDIADYINKNFSDAKGSMDKNQRTTLSNNSVANAGSLIKLLQTGAHDYTNSSNFEQTIAMSMIIAKMLKLTHSK